MAKMPGKQTFSTVLERHPNMNATGITVPFDVEAAFGAKRVPVKATINDTVYRGSVVRMGGQYCLGIPKEFRETAGIAAGDNIVVTLERDDEPRIVEPPDDLAAAIAANKAAAAAWKKLSYTHKREHVRAVNEARKPETRIRRIEKAVEMLAARK